MFILQLKKTHKLYMGIQTFFFSKQKNESSHGLKWDSAGERNLSSVVVAQCGENPQ